MALLGLRIFLKPTSVYSGVLLGGFQCFATQCLLTLGKSWSLRYAAQSSLCTSVPGKTHL